MVDGKPIDIVNYGQRSQGTEVGCCEKDECQNDVCMKNKCQNNAKCLPSSYAGFTCDCTESAGSWQGRFCQKKANYEAFGRDNAVTVNLRNVKSEFDLVTFRFSSNNEVIRF